MLPDGSSIKGQATFVMGGQTYTLGNATLLMDALGRRMTAFDQRTVRLAITPWGCLQQAGIYALVGLLFLATGSWGQEIAMLNVDGLLFRKPILRGGQVVEVELPTQAIGHLVSEVLSNQHTNDIVSEYVTRFRSGNEDDGSPEARKLRGLIASSVHQTLLETSPDYSIFQYELGEVVMRSIEDLRLEKGNG